MSELPRGSDVPGISPESEQAIDEVVAMTAERLRADAEMTGAAQRSTEHERRGA